MENSADREQTIGFWTKGRGTLSLAMQLTHAMDSIGVTYWYRLRCGTDKPN